MNYVDGVFMDVVRLNSNCVLCLLNKHLYCFPEDFSNEQKVEYMQGILKIIANADIHMSTPEIIESINCFKKSLGINADFSQIKSYYNKYMLALEKDIEDTIRLSKDSLKCAIKYAVAGNFIDFGAMDSVDEHKLINILENYEKIAIDNKLFQRFKNEIIKANNIVYLVDNCGEIVLDKLLIKEIKLLNNNANVDVIVRGEPVLNDCTFDDVKVVGIDNVANVFENGTAIAGTVINRLPSKVKDKLDRADLIVSKGQGNFETMRYCGKNVYYMFLCKCNYFAKRFGVEQYTGIFTNETEI